MDKMHSTTRIDGEWVEDKTLNATYRKMKKVKAVVSLLEEYMGIIPKECVLILLKAALE